MWVVSLKRRPSDVSTDVLWSILVPMYLTESLVWPKLTMIFPFIGNWIGLKANGTVTAGSLTLEYTYDVASNNDNGRTLQGFSTGANKKMRHDEDESKEFFPDFQKVRLITSHKV